MQRAIGAIRHVASLTDRAVLFHSASGKDSIALLDLMSPHFKEIVCVYMYVVKDLDHIGRYVSWAQGRYPNARFVQIPHYAVFSYIKTGFLGCAKNPGQKKYTLGELTDCMRERLGIEWAFFGFKKTDGLNRRLMLQGYRDETINESTKKCYPLSTYRNADVLHYIGEHDLIRPENYGGAHQSSGTDITSPDYLLYLREHYPDDLKRVYTSYPMAERILFDLDNKTDEED